MPTLHLRKEHTKDKQMTAFIRIYTNFGKENVRILDAFSLLTEQYDKDIDPIHILMLHDTDAQLVEDTINTIKAGQPCNIYIRFTDDDTEAECTLDCCTVCEETDRILCPNPKLKMTRVNHNDY